MQEKHFLLRIRTLCDPNCKELFSEKKNKISEKVKIFTLRHEILQANMLKNEKEK
jgi:hypothetical protein